MQLFSSRYSVMVPRVCRCRGWASTLDWLITLFTNCVGVRGSGAGQIASGPAANFECFRFFVAWDLSPLELELLTV
jgi:hypothetical protein